MEATRAYPQWPPVLVSAGLGGTTAAMTPDCIPLQPVMVNDPRERARCGGVDCVGILRTCHRNLPGYSYLRPLKRAQYQLMHDSGRFAVKEEAYFNRHYREFVPRDMHATYLKESIRRERENVDVPKWQGNALAGIELQPPTDHAVFFPTGEILQQACVYRNSRDRTRRHLSNTVETGTVIRQFELLGCRDTYEMYGSSVVHVAARGAANCTILTASFGDGEQPTLVVAHKLNFDDMLYHVAGSPHTESAAAFVTGDGKIHTWDSVIGLQTVETKSVSVDERLLRCEYSSNPCVLWTANRVRVQTLDTREPQTSAVSLFDLVKMNAPHSEIYSLKRRGRSPFQLVLGTSVSIEVLDSRMPGKALLSWAQRQEWKPKIPYHGAIDEIHWCSSTDSDKGMVLSSTQGLKTVSLYPFARHDVKSSLTSSSPFLAINPLRSTETARALSSQYVAVDSPLDLQLRDGSDWTTLMGFRALADNHDATSATVYQLNSMGDLFCQQIRPSADQELYETAVQTELPCGITAQPHPQDQDQDGNERLPVPTDAILSEHDAESLTSFTVAPLKTFVGVFPRLPDASAPTEDEIKLESMDNVVDSLRRACRPSATLFRLHRYVNETLGLTVSSQALLKMLRSHPAFSVRSAHHRFRQRVATVLDPFALPITGDHADTRLTMCPCCPQTAAGPCESISCIVPHALLVSSASGIHTEVCFPSSQSCQDGISDTFAAILEQARELYGQNG